MTIRALNEFDSRAIGAGGAPDWRSKLDSQRGAVVATDVENDVALFGLGTTLRHVIIGTRCVFTGVVRGVVAEDLDQDDQGDHQDQRHRDAFDAQQHRGGALGRDDGR